MANKNVNVILKTISRKNPNREPPNSNLPNNNDNIIMITVRYDPNERKLMRGRRRRSTK